MPTPLRVVIAFHTLLIRGHGNVTGAKFMRRNAKLLLRLEPIWHTVKSREDAYKLLKSKYKELNNAIQFSQWLACQKFIVLVKSKPDQNMTELDAWYFRKDIEPYPLGWLSFARPFGFYYSEGFKLKLDQYAQIQKVFVRMIE
jgi:hypothetical protein